MDHLNTAIVFDFILQSEKQVKLQYKGSDEAFKSLYNNGVPFIAHKERFSLMPNSKMVATNWESRQIVEQYGKDPYPQHEYLYFVSKYQVLSGGKKCLYVCIGNMVSFASHSLSSAIIGVHDINNNTITLRKDGIYGYKGDKGTYTKIE